jgi:DNA-binding transcriptional LysR family regulator
VVDFKALETFVRVTDLASFGRAAGRLHTTQPAISQRIARLERALGTKLLERDGRAVTPTAQGRKLLEYARQMLALRDELILEVGGPASIGGVFRLGSSETLVHTWLPDLIREANASFPKLILEMEVDISPRLLERLIDFDLDMAFMTGPVAAPEILSVPVGTYPVAFIASPSSRWRGKRVSMAELAEWPLVTFPRRTQPFQAVENLFRKTKRLPVCLHATASLATATRMALDKTCIAVIPPIIVQPQLASGELEIIDAEESLPDLQFVAAWHAKTQSLAVAELVEMAARIGSA